MYIISTVIIVRNMIILGTGSIVFPGEQKACAKV